MGAPRKSGVGGLILFPALATLAVTMVRLVGELSGWSKALFNPQPGGAWALVGIVWLVPIFGVYFAWTLTKSGDYPARTGRAIGVALLGFGLLAAGFELYQAIFQNLTGIIVMWSLAALGALMQWPAWRGLFRVQLAYAYSARIPVALVMAAATWREWESHYSAYQPGESKLGMFFLFAFIPQLIWWVSFTIIVGSVFGTLVAALCRAEQSA
jgi:hypothetical protein